MLLLSAYSVGIETVSGTVGGFWSQLFQVVGWWPVVWANDSVTVSGATASAKWRRLLFIVSGELRV
jgi:hypothetical protein